MDHVTRVAVIDYGLANIRSVVNALECFDASVIVATEGAALYDADKIVLPGVGSFDAGMLALHARGHVEALESLVRGRKVPFLGICVGMQFLLGASDEGSESGLGWIAGRVHRFPDGPGRPKVPHMGWNEVTLKGRSRLLVGLSPPVDFYFLHSYYVPDEGPCHTFASAIGEYGFPFVASLEFENIFAVQFHPEKSQLAGMKLIETFLAL